MSWTTPNTASVGELIRASYHNTYIRDNLSYLFARPAAVALRATGNMTTTSGTFVDMDGTVLIGTISIARNVVRVTFLGSFTHSTTGFIYLGVDVDGALYGGTGGSCYFMPTQAASGYQSVCMDLDVTGLSAGSHTFKMQWKTSTGTATCLSDTAIPTLFSVREQS